LLKKQLNIENNYQKLIIFANLIFFLNKNSQKNHLQTEKAKISI